MTKLMDLDQAGFPVIRMAIPDVVKLPALVPSVKPATTKHDEWARRQDAVRDAAREFEDLSSQDIKERLKGLTNKPLADPDIEQFKIDTRAAAKDDLVDILDQTTRGKLRGRRTVRVNAPRGYVKKMMRTVTAPEADELETRLKARGWAPEQIKSGLRDKLPHLAPTDV